MIHDLITLAFRRDIANAVMVSGDGDLLDAIESAQVNESEDLEDVAECAERFAREWLRSATDDQYSELLASRPYLAGGPRWSTAAQYGWLAH